MQQRVVTVDNHILEQQRKFPGASGEFSGLLNAICFAAKIISREVNKAGLVRILGITGDTNVHGERIQKLDIYAQNIFVQVLEKSGYLCAMVSEESEEIIKIPDYFPRGKYILCLDPLDGSSNIDVNVSIGTIFGIYRKITDSIDGTFEDVMQPGNKLLGAGYVVYGSSTMLVYSTGHGVHGFTLDPSIGEFLLSHENITLPEQGKFYSINEGYYHLWDTGMQRFITSLKNPEGKGSEPYKLRYIGSMVSDLHRNLLYGGIFLYPSDKKNPNGKLRLLYEAIPMSYIIEQAGGYASDGTIRILDKKPSSLHESTPLIIGGKNDVLTCEKYLSGEL
ncbi:class 1 fructose-bisphosphatase [candidate division KSB1 bacterium]